jgi:hypothetical protein
VPPAALSTDDIHACDAAIRARVWADSASICTSLSLAAEDTQSKKTMVSFHKTSSIHTLQLIVHKSLRCYELLDVLLLLRVRKWRKKIQQRMPRELPL